MPNEAHGPGCAPAGGLVRGGGSAVRAADLFMLLDINGGYPDSEHSPHCNAVLERNNLHTGRGQRIRKWVLQLNRL